jgi:hypothetical protein
MPRNREHGDDLPFRLLEGHSAVVAARPVLASCARCG